MDNYTKKNPPLNQWSSLVERSIYEQGTVEWKEANNGNLLRAVIHKCGYWGNIDYIFPEPSEENDWLYDSDNQSYVGWFIAQYEGLYGFWSHNYAYRSHFFHISADPKGETYYTGGDPPYFLINVFANRELEVVPWDKALSKDHPLLQQAKSECESTSLSFNKSVATRIWNQSTPNTFATAWKNRKNKHLKEQIRKLYGKKVLEYVENKNRGGVSSYKGNTYENFFAVYKIACLYKDAIENNKLVRFSSQALAFVDDIIIDYDSGSFQHFQLKNSSSVQWGTGSKSIADDFYKQYKLNQNTSKESEMVLVVSNQNLSNTLTSKIPDQIKEFSRVFYFLYETNLFCTVQKNVTFYQAIEYLSAFDNPAPDKIESVAAAILGSWASNDKSNASVLEILTKAQRSSSSFIRSFKENLQLDPKVETILNSVDNFTYKISKGFLHWKSRDGLFQGTLPYSIETDDFRRFQERIKKYPPTTFYDLDVML